MENNEKKCFWCGGIQDNADPSYYALCSECLKRLDGGKIMLIGLREEPYFEGQEPIKYFGNIPMYSDAHMIVVTPNFIRSFVDDEKIAERVIADGFMFLMNEDFLNIANQIDELKNK